MAVFASPRPPLAEYVHSSTCIQRQVSYSRTCVGTDFFPVSCRDGCTAHHVRWYRYGAGISVSLRFSAIPGRDPSPGGQRTTLPARRVGHGTRNAPGTEKGCCEGGTWCHSETAGGRAELEARSFFLSVLAPVMRRGQRRAAVWVDVAPQRDRGRPSGTRGSQLLLGVL